MSEQKQSFEEMKKLVNFDQFAERVLQKEPLLSAQNVEVTFSLRGNQLKAIRGASLDLYEGETLAIVGESGSGKSVFTKLFVGMLDKNGKITNGKIEYDGMDLTTLSGRDWLKIRGKKIAMVTQDPMTSLNPLKTIGYQIQESVELHQGLKGKAAREEVYRILEAVGIPDPKRRYKQYPHEDPAGAGSRRQRRADRSFGRSGLPAEKAGQGKHRTSYRSDLSHLRGPGNTVGQVEESGIRLLPDAGSRLCPPVRPGPAGGFLSGHAPGADLSDPDASRQRRTAAGFRRPGPCLGHSKT